MDFYDWMVDSNYPNGLVVTDEMELIRQHPEYLELSSEPPEKQAKLSQNNASDAGLSAVNTPIVTDIGSEVESQAGQESAQRSPAFASPALSQDDDKEVDDLEDDILGGMEVKPAQPGKPLLLCSWSDECCVYAVSAWLISSPTCSLPAALTSYKTDPAYLRLLPVRDKLLKSLRDAERDVNEYATKVSVSSNVVVMVRSDNGCRHLVQGLVTDSVCCSSADNLQKRVKQLLETAQTQRDEIAAELEKVCLPPLSLLRYYAVMVSCRPG